MKIIADQSIPLVKETFSSIGDVTLFSVQDISRENIGDADILIIRTLTKVDKTLVDDRAVKFIGTNAVGTDHIDLDYLKDRGVGFANAKGCNSKAVAEYVFAALYSLARNLRFELTGLKLGVVGVGNIGSIVARMAEGLGMVVKKNDPPLRRKTNDRSFVDLDELMDCDIITLHVPLTFEGIDATHHFFDRERIFKMKRGSILINTSRGAVVETEGLIDAVDSGHLWATVVDVWENEPEIDTELLKRVSIGTPHIAGYSYEGKVMGTYLVYKKTCKYFGLDCRWTPDKILTRPETDEIEINGQGRGEVELIDDLIRKVYDIRKDCNNLSMIQVHPESERSEYFINLRNNYRIRREFHNFHVKLKNCPSGVEKALKVLGFKICA